MSSDPNIIGVKQLHAQLKDIAERAQRGEEFIVVKNSLPVFKIIPLSFKKKPRKKQKTLFEELKDIQFHTGDPDLSQNIDTILYE